ncbi:MAG: ATP-binding protein [Chthoniobacterales bacterium]
MQARVDALTTPLSELRRIDSTRSRPSSSAAAALALALVALIGWIDYVTGDFSLTVFYLIPVGLATWYAGRSAGWCIGILSAVAWLVGDLATHHPAGHPFVPYWNAAMPALMYGVVAELFSALHRVQGQLEERVVQRTASLLQANQELDVARLRFMEADKFESIGRLAAGVAHEVKNPLMTIVMVAEYLSAILPASETEGHGMIGSLHEAVDRANRVIGELLDFSRPGALSLLPENFQSVAERALGLIRHEANRKGIRIVREWCEPAPDVLLDRNKMGQVLINVLLNAIQATPEGGTITLRTRIRRDLFCAEIEDTGPGISPVHQPKLFEPFFTTKPVGKGTGLGLSVARQITQLHHGTLVLTNKPDGSGARVTIQLPLDSSHTS